MLVFKKEQHIEAMLDRSLQGVLITLATVEDYGYCFTLVQGKDNLAYVCFYEAGNGCIEAIAEKASYEDKRFGEMQDGSDTADKRQKFITACHEIGIDEAITDYYLSMLERCALGEAVELPSLSGSTVSKEILCDILKIRDSLICNDEPKTLEGIAEIHEALNGINKTVYPFGYSGKLFNQAFSLNIKRTKRYEAFAMCLDYYARCATNIRRKIENGHLLEIIEQQTIKRESYESINN